MGDHPSSEELAAYLSGGLSSEARDGFEKHLADCRLCRNEVASARRLLAVGPAKKRPWIGPLALAAVIAIGFFSISTSKRGGEEPTRNAANPASADGTVNVRVVTPVDGAIVSGLPVFTWRAHGADALYRFSVTDASGATIWSTETNDTSVSLPADVSLEVSRDYLWNVDAIDSDGTTVTSGTHRFRITR